MRGHRQDNGALEGFFNATVDAALALQTCVLAAETVGLGTCPISVLRNRITEVAAILELPDKVFPIAGLCLGYPVQQGFISMRLPLEATVHIDRYDDSGLPEAVDGYDRRRDARHSIKDRQRDPARFGTAEFYGWSEDKARQAMTAEGAGFASLAQGARLHFRRAGCLVADYSLSALGGGEAGVRRACPQRLSIPAAPAHAFAEPFPPEGRRGDR